MKLQIVLLVALLVIIPLALAGSKGGKKSGPTYESLEAARQEAKQAVDAQLIKMKEAKETVDAKDDAYSKSRDHLRERQLALRATIREMYRAASAFEKEELNRITNGRQTLSARLAQQAKHEAEIEQWRKEVATEAAAAEQAKKDAAAKAAQAKVAEAQVAHRQVVIAEAAKQVDIRSDKVEQLETKVESKETEVEKRARLVMEHAEEVAAKAAALKPQHQALDAQKKELEAVAQQHADRVKKEHIAAAARNKALREHEAEVQRLYKKVAAEKARVLREQKLRAEEIERDRRAQLALEAKSAAEHAKLLAARLKQIAKDQAVAQKRAKVTRQELARWNAEN